MDITRIYVHVCFRKTKELPKAKCISKAYSEPPEGVDSAGGGGGGSFNIRR